MPSLAGALTRLGRLTLPAIPSPSYFATKSVSDTWSLTVSDAATTAVDSDVAVSDTWSASFTDSGALSISNALSRSDTWSLTYSLESGAITLATDIAGSDTWAAVLSDAAAVGTYPREKTQLSLLSLPGPYANVSAKSVTGSQAIDVSDTWALSWTETPVDLVESQVTDSWRLTLAAEISSLSISQTFAANDTWSLSWSEVASVFAGGPISPSVTDAWSLALSEASIVAATVDASDTWSIQIADSSALDISSDTKDGTDTWSLAFTLETGFFSPIVEIPILASDEWRLVWSEVSRVVPFSNDRGLTRVVTLRAINRIVRIT